MDTTKDLPGDERRSLKLIADCWVPVDYWEDPTITRYRDLGFVFADGGRIRLTEAGKRACSEAP
jgi:hypothetical protein